MNGIYESVRPRNVREWETVHFANYNIKVWQEKMGDNPSGNIPLGADKPDGEKAGGGPPRTSFVNNMLDEATKQFGETL